MIAPLPRINARQRTIPPLGGDARLGGPSERPTLPAEG